MLYCFDVVHIWRFVLMPDSHSFTPTIQVTCNSWALCRRRRTSQRWWGNSACMDTPDFLILYQQEPCSVAWICMSNVYLLRGVHVGMNICVADGLDSFVSNCFIGAVHVQLTDLSGNHIGISPTRRSRFSVSLTIISLTVEDIPYIAICQLSTKP